MNVKEDGFFRFHNTKHLREVVCNKGYVEGEIGERSKTDDEPVERIYFSKGLTGVYKIASKVMLDLIFRKRGYDKKQEEINHTAEGEEKVAKMVALEQELKSIRLEEQEQEEIFSSFKEFYQNQTYMVVDLQEGEDFSPEDNWSLANMHTKEGVKIPKEKIKILGVLKEDELATDGFGILKSLYARYRKQEQFEEDIGESYYIDLLDQLLESSISEQDKRHDLKIMNLDEYKQMKDRTSKEEEMGRER